MSFLDEKCIVFDGGEENKLEYTAVHSVSQFDYNFNIIITNSPSFLFAFKHKSSLDEVNY